MKDLTIHKLIKVFFLPALFLFACPENNYSQHRDNYILQIDKPFYTTGELIWYKLNLPFYFTEHDASITALIVDSNSNVIDQHFHQSKNQQSISGYYKIPFEITSGNYLLSLQIHNEAGNKMIEVANISLAIFNDFSDEQAAFIPELSQGPAIGERLSVVIFPKEVSSTTARNEQSFKVRVFDELGEPVQADVCVSILDKSLVFGNDAKPYIPLSVSRAARLSAPNSKPGFYGKVTDNSGNPVQVNILGGYSQKGNNFFYAKSDKEGNFNMPLNEFYENQTIQFVHHLDAGVNLNYEWNYSFNTNRKSSVKISEEVLNEYLQQSRNRKKLNQYFNISNDVEIPELPKIEAQTQETYGNYNLKEYKSFKNIGNFFIELLTPLKYNLDDNGNYSARMTNPTAEVRGTEYLGDKPLFMVDGKVTKNADFVGKLEFSNVGLIQLFYEPQKLRKEYNILGMEGVIKVNTSLPDIQLPEEDMSDIFTINGIQYPVSTFELSRNDFAEQMNGPLLGPLIYWNADLKTDQNGNLNVNYLHNDELSEFVIMVTCVASNGDRGTIIKEYSVEDF